MFASMVLAMALNGSIDVDVSNHLAKDSTIEFKLVNRSSEPVTLDTDDSPCNNLRLAIFMTVKKGYFARIIQRTPYIEDFGGDKIIIQGYGKHICNFSLSHWFGKNISALSKDDLRDGVSFFWTFQPDSKNIYSKDFYSGGFFIDASKVNMLTLSP